MLVPTCFRRFVVQSSVHQEVISLAYLETATQAMVKYVAGQESCCSRLFEMFDAMFDSFRNHKHASPLQGLYFEPICKDPINRTLKQRRAGHLQVRVPRALPVSPGYDARDMTPAFVKNKPSIRISENLFRGSPVCEHALEFKVMN